MYCILPAVGNLTRLLRVKRRSFYPVPAAASAPDPDKPREAPVIPVTKVAVDLVAPDNDVLFFGYPLDLYYSG